MLNYMREKNRVRQKIDNMSIYDLEGDLDAVIERLKQHNALVNQDMCLSETNWKGEGQYADGEKKRIVRFDKLVIDTGTNYEGTSELQLFGERDITNEELIALKAKDLEDAAKQREYHLQQYEFLKKKLNKE